MKSMSIFNQYVFLLIGILFSIKINAQVGQIIWEENFTTLDTTLWNITEGNGCPDLCGWGNNELEYYHKDNVYIEEINGEEGNYALVLEAKDEVLGSNQFTSGKITTEGNVAVKYGMIEVRMKVPDLEVGLWPAVWLLGTNHNAVGWPKCGEIDIVEMGQSAQFRSDKGHPDASENDIAGSNLLFYSKDACADDNQTCAASIAYDNYYCTPYRASSPLNDRYVIYRVYWDETNIQFTVEDNGITHNMYTGPFPIGNDAQEFTKPFYMILNLAVGGDFTDASTAGQVTSPLPGKMYIDYIRIRKWNGKGEITTPGSVMANAGSNIDVELNDTISLNGMGSYGNIQTYTWTIADSLISSAPTHKLVLPSGTHKVQLTVTDINGNVDSDEIIVKVGTNGIGEILWEENFDSFNSEIWNSITGDGCDQGPDMCGWGNAELEYYHPNNVSIEEITGDEGNSALVIEAKKETMGSSSFTSGKITTENNLAIKYGVVEVRMKAPDVESGLWPAAWMLGINHNSVGWPECGEIDMMEMGQSDTERERQGYGNIPQNRYVGANLLWYEPGACALENQTCAASIAYDTWYDSPYIASSPLNERFVIYRTYWDESQIRFTVEDNGIEYDLYEAPFPISESSAAFRKPFYFVLNLAVGGWFTDILSPEEVTAPLPAKMYVDYVRVRKWNGKGEVAFTDGNSLANAGADQSVVDTNRNGLEMVTLDASSSYGNIVSYEWAENGAVIATGINPTVQLSTGNHFITLTTIDKNDYVSSDQVLVDVREILWEEDFNSLNTNLWNVITGDGCPELCGWGNQELEYYHEDNVYTQEIVDDPGNYALVLEAKSESMGSSSFTSGKITTQDNMSVRYGLIEVRMQVPDLETGLWPAAWLLGKNFNEVGWPECGEIDMMEMGQSTQFREDKGIPDATENNVVGANLIFYDDAACSGENQDCAASISYDNFYCNPYNAAKPLNNRFVTYRTYWDDMEIRFTVEDNGKEYDLYTGPFPIGIESSEFHKPFYLLLNLAVGGNFTDASSVGDVTAPLPAKMLVDYVRVMKWNGKGEIDFNDGLIANAGTDILVVDKDGDKKETVTLDGTGSISYDGSIVSYTWTENGTEVATGSSPSLSLTRASHEIVLTVTDDLGQTESDTVNVIVSGGGLAPIADAGNDTTVYDDNDDDLVTFMLDGSRSTAANAPIIKYKWINGMDTIATGVSANVELSTGINEITLEVIDEDSLIGNDQIIITVIDPNNIAPVANAGNSITAIDTDGDDMETITFDGSASSDSDGVIEDYSWLINDEEVANGVNSSVELSTGFYLVKLQVTDNDGTVSFSQVSATIIDPDNLAPIANAGIDTILIDEDLDGVVVYTLDAELSSDSDGTIESYKWFDDSEEIATKVSASVELSLGLHTIVLVVTDDDGIATSDTVLIKVNQLPVAIAGSNTILTDTDETGNEVFMLDASESYDPFGTIISYSWMLNDTEISTAVSENYVFNVGANPLTLTVTDDDNYSVSDKITVFVARTNNNAPIANAGEDINAQEDDGDGKLQVKLDASNSSDPDGTIYSYSWIENEVEIAQGVNPMVIFEVGSHKITLMVTDNEGAKSTDEVFVTIIQRDNLALNKTTFTSSNENDATIGKYAVDGDESTRWASLFSDPQWIYVDLEDTYNLNEVVIVWEAAYASDYEVQVSNDANSWTTIFTERSGDGEIDVINLEGTGRYLRIYGTSRATEYGYSIYELEVYGTSHAVNASSSLSDLRIDDVSVDGFSSNKISYNVTLKAGTTVVPTVTAQATDENAEVVINVAESLPGETTVVVTSADKASSTTYTVSFTVESDNANLALNKNVVTSSDESTDTQGSNAVDGNASTRWSSLFSDPQWIYVDLEENYKLSKVVINWEAAHASEYEIQISDDASSWSTIFTEPAGNGGINELPVNGTGRYVRMYGTSRATVYGYSIYEFEVYGTNATNINDGNSNSLSVLVYPNPVNDMLNVQVNEGEIEQIQVYNTQGMKITDVFESSQIDMSNLNKGMYLVKVTVNGMSFTSKVVKK